MINELFGKCKNILVESVNKLKGTCELESGFEIFKDRVKIGEFSKVGKSTNYVKALDYAYTELIRHMTKAKIIKMRYSS